MNEQLIEKVRHHEILYNLQSSYYRDQNMRYAAWKEIGKELKITAADAKDAWAKLRNCYTNAIKRRNLKKGAEAVNKIPWKYEREMSFLKPYIDTRQAQNNLKDEQSQQCVHIESSISGSNQWNYEEDDRDNQNEDALVAYESVQEVKFVPTAQTLIMESATNTNLSRPSRSLSKRESKVFNSTEEMVKAKKQKTEQCRQKYVSTEDKNFGNLDETDMFYLSMSRTVKHLPELDQARIRMDLCTMISEAQIRSLEDVAAAGPSNTYRYRQSVSPNTDTGE